MIPHPVRRLPGRINQKHKRNIFHLLCSVLHNGIESRCEARTRKDDRFDGKKQKKA